MDLTIKYLMEAQDYLSQIVSVDYSEIFILEETADPSAQETSQKNDELKKKASGSISKAIGSLIERIGEFISNIISAIKQLFTGDDNSVDSMTEQYRMAQSIDSTELSKIRIKIHDNRKFIKECKGLLSELQRARKSKNETHIKEVMNKIDKAFEAKNGENNVVEVSMQDAIDIVSSARDISKSEQRELKRLEDELKATMNKINPDEAESNGKETSSSHYESGKRIDIVKRALSNAKESAIGFKNGMESFIKVCKSKGKDVGAIIDMTDAAFNNKPFGVLCRGISGAGAALLDGRATKEQKTLSGSASRILKSKNGKTKVNVGAASRFVNSALKDSEAHNTIGAVSAVGSGVSHFVQGNQDSKKAKRGRNAAQNAANDMLS